MCQAEAYTGNRASRRSFVSAAGVVGGVQALALLTSRDAVAAGGRGLPSPSIVGPGRTVVRYTAASKYRVQLRSTPVIASRANVVTTLAGGVKLSGRYTANGLWFAITSGPYRGRWISSSVLVASADASQVNGQLAPSDMITLPARLKNRAVSPGASLAMSRAAGLSFLAMSQTFEKVFATPLTVSEAYRPLASQRYYFRTLGPRAAAVPGTSNHGLGNAVDLGFARYPGVTSPLRYGGWADRWLTVNGWRWGFDRPAYMDARGSKPEWWHYNFTG